MIDFYSLFPAFAALSVFVIVLGLVITPHYDKCGQYILYIGIVFGLIVSIVVLILGCGP